MKLYTSVVVKKEAEEQANGESDCNHVIFELMASGSAGKLSEYRFGDRRYEAP